MILYYAMGGGLGHLTRARAVIHSLEIKEAVTVLTAADFAKHSRVFGGADVLMVPSHLANDLDAYKEWLRTILDQLSPNAIYLDTFPAGILGEFIDFPLPAEMRVYYITRLLRWKAYCKQLTGVLPSFELAYTIEPLERAHEEFLSSHCKRIEPLWLRYPPQEPDSELIGRIGAFKREGLPLWVIVHSGSDEEILELISYAEEMCEIEEAKVKLLLIAPHRPNGLNPNVAYLDHYPASAVFPSADRIITACGFNTMLETEPYREKHRFIPFARRFDDQFMRAGRRAKEQAQQEFMVSKTP